MGASTTTPNLGLPQFSDTDKPTWRGDLNGAFQILDDVIQQKANKATIDYYVADYSAVGDGATDDTTHIQAAIDDAASHGGGIVHLMRGKTHLIDGEVFVKTNVLLMGDIGNYNATAGAANNTPSIKFGSVNSRIRVGTFPGNNGSTNGENPVGISNITIDCNSTGPTAINDGCVYVEGTFFKFEEIYITGAAGTALYFQATQNCQFESINIKKSNIGICLDNGAGGLIFTRCEISDNQTGILATDNQSMGNAYPYGSAHVVFEHCIVENYSPVAIEVDIQAGTLQFNDCGFSNNQSTISSGTLVKISNPIYTGISTNAIFNGCIFVSAAGESLVTVNGNNKFYAYGQNYLQGSATAGVNTNAFVQDSGIGVGQIDGNVYQLHITKLVATANGGNVSNWLVGRSAPVVYTVDSALNQFAILVKELGDAGIRATIASNGSYNFYSGADYTQQGSISLNAALKILYYTLTGHIFQGPVEFDNTTQFDDAMHALAGLTVDGATVLNGVATIAAAGLLTEIKGNLTVDGNTTHTGTTTNTGTVTQNGTTVHNGLLQVNKGRTESVPLVYPPAGGGAVAVDCNVTNHAFIVLTGTANITALNISNNVAGQRLRVTYDVTDGAPRNLFWPNGAIAGAGKTLPASAASNGVYSIDFQYINGAWFEVGRNF